MSAACGGASEVQRVFPHHQDDVHGGRVCTQRKGMYTEEGYGCCPFLLVSVDLYYDKK